MTRRIGIGALCCVAVLALCATSALAATEWWIGKGKAQKVLPKGAPTQVKASGKLGIYWPENKPEFGAVCDVALTGTVENPAAGGNGIDSVESMTFTNCKRANICAKGEAPYVKEKANGATKLETGPPILDKFENMVLEVGCSTKGEIDTWKGTFSAAVTTDDLEFAKATGASTLKGTKTGTTAYFDGKLKKLETVVTPPAKAEEITAK